MSETVAASYLIRVVEHDAWTHERDSLRTQGLSMWDQIKSTETVPFEFFVPPDHPEQYRFCVVCPGCGGNIGGITAAEPVSGWDEPRWKIEVSDPKHLTMTPSLGCGGWRAGSCPGHWWVRDGRLWL